jgi:hypothetical protein
VTVASSEPGCEGADESTSSDLTTAGASVSPPALADHAESVCAPSGAENTGCATPATHAAVSGASPSQLQLRVPLWLDVNVTHGEMVYQSDDSGKAGAVTIVVVGATASARPGAAVIVTNARHSATANEPERVRVQRVTGGLLG